MKIWVDADACPTVIKETLFRAAERKEVILTLVANHALRVPPSKVIKSIRVESGFDIADDYIVQAANKGDLVITNDIPLADEVISLGCHVINTRGEQLTKENIKSRLNIRDFMDTMRASGVNTGGPPPLSQRERQAFANQLDRLLQKAKH